MPQVGRPSPQIGGAVMAGSGSEEIGGVDRRCAVPACRPGLTARATRLRPSEAALAVRFWRDGRGRVVVCPGGVSARCVGHVQQLGGESPLHNLMEVKC